MEKQLCNSEAQIIFAGSEESSLIIDTTVEYFHSKKWFSNIPVGKMLALQSCNLKHKENAFCVHSKEELKEQVPLADISYSETLNFNYPITSFSRYMLSVENNTFKDKYFAENTGDL